jgi:hypothetical protein
MAPAPGLEPTEGRASRRLTRQNEGFEHARAREETASAPEVSETDPVIEALERALTEAVAAKDWPRASVLARELDNRQRALTSANVVCLSKPKRGDP